MPQFKWEGRDRQSRRVTGTIEAASKDEVVSRLQQQGLMVVNVDAGSARSSGTVDFVSRLESHQNESADFAARLQPRAPRHPVLMPMAVGAVFAAMGMAVRRYIPDA